MISENRIQSHFQVFASLALLACYLDWTVLLTASSVVVMDHIVRGIFWPWSVIGNAGVAHRAWLEDAVWVMLADVVLLWAIIDRRRCRRTVIAEQAKADTPQNLVYTDVLTGLPNQLSFQRWMEEHLQQRRAGREPFALMYIDLDRFSEINARLGHTAGDSVLHEVARRLSACLVPRSLLTRVGGDEFILTFSHVPPHEEFFAIAQEVTSLLMLPFPCHGGRLVVGASIGISIFPQDGNTAQKLVYNAEQAMHHVKQQGRRGFHFCDTPGASSADAFTERDLQNAIDNDLLELHFQPLVNLSGTLIALEALVRWRCPERGLVPPAEFIGMAEQSGQIVTLGRVVLDKATQQAAAWLREGLDFGHITINVSPRQLLERDFVHYLEDLFKRHDVPAWAICLECTESACASDAEVQSQLQKVHARGTRIYVDDFGTGYSSLGRLQEMQFDVIKIDRCFIQRLSTETGSEIVSLMISFAHLLGMTVVAEGVETIEEFEALQALGCDHIQGYFISKPMETADATRFLRGEPPVEEWAAAAMNPLLSRPRAQAAISPPRQNRATSRLKTASRTASWAEIFALRPTRLRELAALGGTTQPSAKGSRAGRHASGPAACAVTTGYCAPAASVAGSGLGVSMRGSMSARVAAL